MYQGAIQGAYKEHAELVGICDSNPGRLELARRKSAAAGATPPAAYAPADFEKMLTEQRVDTVIVTGCTTSGCVRATIIDAFSYGFRVLVPQDCVGDADEAQHRANLADGGRRYADVTDSASIRAYLERLPLDR
jgi:nicotinamidase-related amidase